MKTRVAISKREAGTALLLVMILSAVALVILGSIMDWSSTSSKLTHRSIQYTRSVSAAEAATEKVVGQITHDFLYEGQRLVDFNLNNYRLNTVPTTSESPYWANWQFDDGNGHNGQTYVQQTQANSYKVLDSTYAGLKGFVSTYSVVSHASDTASIQDVNAGVLQELQLTAIPIYQFAMYSSGDMEISCGQPFDVTGRVHSNKTLYVEPDSSLTFESSVTAVVDILFQRDPLDPRGSPGGGVVYVNPDEKQSPVVALTLPIGTTNTPEAIREIIEPPPPGEDPSSPIGVLRFYNQCDMVVTVNNNGVTATSGNFNGFSTPISAADLALFVSTNLNFYDAREGKTVLPIDIDVGILKTWSETNKTLATALGPGALQSSIYVNDQRTLPSTVLGAVRVKDGLLLPTNGLTVATGRPLYVQGNYNELNSANLGTSNTLNTRPASLVADAITILSTAWNDPVTGPGVSPPGAGPTTVNAALLTGVVETTTAAYSGGMENFPRFLENWGAANILTYNGSMVRMFPSRYATGLWGQANVYNPPKRNWAYDINFDSASKLPPLTPSLLKVARSRWSTVPPGINTVASTP